MNNSEIYEKIERDLRIFGCNNSWDTLSLCKLYASYSNSLTNLVEGEDYTDEIEDLSQRMDVLKGLMALRLMSEHGFYSSNKTGLMYWYSE